MIALDPTERVPVTPPGYMALPPEKRPRFLARFMTVREFYHRQELLEKTDDLKVPGAQRLDAVIEVLRLNLVGWENVLDAQGQPIPFDVAKLPDILSLDEFWRLPSELLTATSMTEDERKKSGSTSPSPSPATNSTGAAATATPGSAV